MEFLAEYGLFLAKAVTIVVSVLAIAVGIFAVSAKQITGDGEELEISKLNDKYEHMKSALESTVLSKKGLKAQRKARKAEHKAEEKEKDRQKNPTSKPRVFVIDFKGDIKASAVASLRQEIDAVLTTATNRDQVIVRLESPGGVVHGYGLAASQLNRLRNHNIPLTACVDKVAASGGYLMACVADRIIAAPFAIIGSIGVVAQVPNFHKVLKKNEIDFEQFTAGEHKRTVTMFGETTESAREKVREEIQEIHDLFKDYITERRPQLDIHKVSTGEHWLGTRALDLKLVDELRTSDDYLMERVKEADVYKVTFKRKKTVMEKLFGGQSPVSWMQQAINKPQAFPYGLKESVGNTIDDNSYLAIKK